jgi:hypothetical protein
MSELVCPKCSGTDYFISQRNIVKGRGVYQSGKMRGVPVCRECDEIMSDPRIANISNHQSIYSTKDRVLYFILLALMFPSIWFFGSFIGFLALAISGPLMVYLLITYNKNYKRPKI